MLSIYQGRGDWFQIFLGKYLNLKLDYEFWFYKLSFFFKNLELWKSSFSLRLILNKGFIRKRILSVKVGDLNLSLNYIELMEEYKILYL